MLIQTAGDGLDGHHRVLAASIKRVLPAGKPGRSAEQLVAWTLWISHQLGRGAG